MAFAFFLPMPDVSFSWDSAEFKILTGELNF